MSVPSSEKAAAGEDCGLSRLTAGLIQQIASYLHPNEVITSLKQLNHETAQCLKEYRLVQLSQPLTPAPSWASDHPVHVAVQSWPSALFVAHWGRPQPWRTLSLRQRRRLLCLAANSGCAASLEAALAQCGCSLTSKVAMAAVLGGSVSACETLLIREGCESMARLEDVAAEAGHLEVLRWLREARRDQLLLEPPQQLLDDQLRSEQAPDEVATAVAACRGGHAHILAWLQEEEEQARQQAQPQEEQQALRFVTMYMSKPPLKLADRKAVQYLAGAAAAGGHVQLLDQLLPRLEPVTAGALCCAELERVAKGCTLEVLQRVYNHLCGLESAMLPSVCAKRSLVVAAAVSNTADWEQKLDWVLQQEAYEPLTERPFAHAYVMSDYIVLCHAAGRLPDWLQRLQALRARNVPLPPLLTLAMRAAIAGDVAALTCLLAEQSEGVPAREQIASAAVAAGHVPILSVLHAWGCVFSGDDVMVAARAGHAAAVGWLLAQPLQPPAADRAAVFQHLADQGADLDTLRHLHERHGAPIDLEAVAKYGSVEALEWAVAALQRAGAERPEVQVGGAAVACYRIACWV